MYKYWMKPYKYWDWGEFRNNETPPDARGWTTFYRPLGEYTGVVYMDRKLSDEEIKQYRLEKITSVWGVKLKYLFEKLKYVIELEV